jgi:YD repeat-containing protein
VKTEFITVGNVSEVPSKTAVKNFTYDRNGNVTEVAEYDWAGYIDSPSMRTAIPAGASLVRTTRNEMKYPTAPASSAKATDEINGYWNPGSNPMRFAVASKRLYAAGAPETLAAFSQWTYNANGNPTLEAKWDSSRAATAPAVLDATSAVVTVRNYDSYGNVTSMADPEGNATTFAYGRTCNTDSLYVTQRVEPGPRTFNYKWNCAMGAAASVFDAQNAVTTLTGYDIYGRVNSVTDPGLRVKSTTFSDAARVVKSAADLNALSDGNLVTVTGYDDIGRPHLVRSTDEVKGKPDSAELANGMKVKMLYSVASGDAGDGGDGER